MRVHVHVHRDDGRKEKQERKEGVREEALDRSRSGSGKAKTKGKEERGKRKEENASCQLPPARCVGNCEVFVSRRLGGGSTQRKQGRQRSPPGRPPRGPLEPP